MPIILIAWIILVLLGIRYSKETICPFSLNNSLALRGICSIEIMIGHLGLPNATNSLYLYPNRKAGILFVGIFFALSGYGLMHCTIHKKGYLDSFLIKRIFKILFPAYAIFVFGILIKYFMHYPETFLYDILNFKSFFHSTNWYVWEIVLLYIVYYIFIRKGKNGIYYIMISVCVFTILAYLIGLDNPWYGSTFCFLVGIILCIHENEFLSKIKVQNRHWLKIIIINSLITSTAILLFIFLGDQNMIGILILRNIASISFCILVITLLCKFEIGNYLSYFLGKYSYEIFLFHPIYIDIFRDIFSNDLIFSVTVIFSSVISSIIFIKTGKFMYYLVNKKKIKEIQ